MAVIRKTKLNDAQIGYVLERLHPGFTKDKRVVRMIAEDKATSKTKARNSVGHKAAHIANDILSDMKKAPVVKDGGYTDEG